MFLRSVRIGVTGGLIAALVWLAATYLFGREFGWLACGIGLAAGLAVRRYSHSDRREAASAAMLATLAVAVLAKYFVATDLASKRFEPWRQQLVKIDEETMIATVADEIAQERLLRNEPVAWPPGITYEDALAQEDYPSDVWQAAVQRWSAFSSGEQERRIAEHQKRLDDLASRLSNRLAKPRMAAAYSPSGFAWPLAGMCVALGCTVLRRHD